MLRDILDKGIATITAEDRVFVVNKYVAIKAQMVYNYSLLLKVVFGFFVLGLLFLWRYYELKKYSKELLYLSETDLLTKIYNRMKIEKELVIHVEQAKRLKQNFSILLIDFDFFKTINDTFGHPIGDKVLTEVASLIKESIRHNDMLGRWGGEEFLVLCPQSDHKDALNVAKRIQKIVQKGIFSTHKHHTVSIGVATLTSEDTPYTLVNHADNALYKAKDSGRNTICFAVV